MLSPTEILLSVAFPLLVTVGVGIVLSDSSSTEFWVARLCLALAAADLLGLSAYWLYLSPWPLVARLMIAALAGVIVVPAAVGLLVWSDYRQAKVQEQHAPTVQPEVSLRFVYPKSPALMIINQSAAIARDIKWTVILWNMDLPERNDPLPIPVSTFDWLRPHAQGGPQNLFDGPLVSPLLKAGNRLFGSASVICPTCARGRTYIVYIVWGQDGWVAEIPDEVSGNLVIPPKLSKEYREAYFKQLEATVPTHWRVPIGER